MSEVVLKRLLTMDIYREIKVKKDSHGNKKISVNEEDLIIMTKGKAIDFFVLIIEGNAELPSFSGTNSARVSFSIYHGKI